MQRIRLRPLGFQQPQAIAWTTFWRSLGPEGPMSWVKQDAILGGSHLVSGYKGLIIIPSGKLT